MGKPLKMSLIISIVVLFLSTACLPVLASEGKPDLITVDDNEEIITFISGSSDGAYVIKKGFIRDIEITAGGGGTGLEIEGWKRNSTESFFYTGIEYIHASRFIGFFTGYKYRPVRGIAFGNIEWSW